MEELSETSTEVNILSESQDTIDNLLESMDEQINDLYAIVKNQNSEIEELKRRVENFKSVISSHLTDHLKNIIDFL